MTIDPMRHQKDIIQHCDDLEFAAAALYRAAVNAQMPDEILRSVAFLSCDIAAIYNRINALDGLSEDARQP